MTTYRRILVLAALTPAFVGFANAADVTGKWKAEFESPVGHLKYTYDLKADGDKLTGKAMRELDGAKTEAEIKEGKLDGDEVSFVELLRRDDQDVRIEYKGKVAGDEIKFTRKVGDFATMEIVARREKETATAARKVTLKVVKVDSQETEGEDGKGANAVDGNAATFWHTAWDESVRPPHEIIIELSASAKIKGFTYLPRQDEEVNGTIKDYEFYVSDDGKDFGQPVKKGTFHEGKEKKTVTFEAKPCRFIKLKALSEINDAAWTSAAEIDVIPE
jgi:F5/8 type C domain